MWKLAMFKATASINFPCGSAVYKDPPEVVLALYGRQYPEKTRRAQNNDWARNEIPFPINRDTYEFFLSCAYEIDARLRGVK